MEILEYCEPSEILKREQYYIDFLKPKYNILKTAGSLLNYKHPVESKSKNWTAERLADHLERLYIHNASKEQKERLKRRNSSKKHKEHLKRLHASLALAEGSLHPSEW